MLERSSMIKVNLTLFVVVLHAPYVYASTDTLSPMYARTPAQSANNKHQEASSLLALKKTSTTSLLLSSLAFFSFSLSVTGARIIASAKIDAKVRSICCRLAMTGS